MKKKETLKRHIVFIIGLMFIGIGIAFTKRAELGVSPVSSVANIISLKFKFFSLGTWLIISNLILLLGQVLILGKRFKLIQLMQIPLSFAFGYFTDFGLWLVGFIPNDVYAVRLSLVLIGVVFLALGIALGVMADALLNSGEAFVKTLSIVSGKDFSTMKVIFDVSWVAISVLLSLLLFNGALLETREGTVISAILTGFVVKLWQKALTKPIEKILKR